MIGGLSNTVTTLSLNDLPSAAPEALTMRRKLVSTDRLEKHAQWKGSTV